MAAVFAPPRLTLSTAAAAALFEFAPISLWYEDFTALKNQLDGLRLSGVTDLRAWLETDPSRLQDFWNAIRVMAVNRETLSVFAAADLGDLSTSAPQIFHDEMAAGFIDELAQLWTTNTGFACRSVNYSLDGRRIDIRIRGRILPGYEGDWSRVVVAIEDVTAEEEARRQRAESEAFAQALFEQSPVALWVHDFSCLKQLLDDARGANVTDLRAHIAEQPEFLQKCIQAMRVKDVNQHTLALYRAPDKPTLFSKAAAVLPPETWPYLVDTLAVIFSGPLSRAHETVHYTLTGDRLDLVLQFSVMPGHEHDWSTVLLALTDITARKKAEASLAFISRHDVPTGLFNRAFYIEETGRLDAAGPFPVSVIIADLNGLKEVNDREGHAAGDVLIRRAAEILQAAAQRDCPAGSCAARIGGDEFVLLLPGTTKSGATSLKRRIATAIAVDNALNQVSPLSLSVGHATCHDQGGLEAAIRDADFSMYRAKRAYYAASGANRRR